jgi:predicted neutral ceramidase superfamily lipid hydrolase
MMQSVIVFLETLLLQGVFLNFVLKMERNNCECSADVRRDIIKYYSVFMVISSLLVLVFKSKCNVMCSLITLLNVVYAGIIVSYIFKLRKENCECAKTWGSNVMYYWALLVCLALLVILVNMGTFAFLMRK